LVTPKTSLIIRAHLQGMSKAAICKEFKMAPGTLKRIMDSPLYKQRISALQDQIDEKTTSRMASDPVREVLAGAALRAAQENVAFLDSSDDKIRQASIWDILDRAGYPKKQRSEIEHVTKIVLPEDSVRALGEALRECMDTKDES